MSREIKFRAWHKNTNYMCYNVNTNLLDREYLIFMQYVGFKDKNGQEIYEGDIDQGGYVVTYVADLGSNLGMNAGWYLQRDNFESWSQLECSEDIEIMGNVFENPEKAINNCNTNYMEMF